MGACACVLVCERKRASMCLRVRESVYTCIYMSYGTERE